MWSSETIYGEATDSAVTAAWEATVSNLRGKAWQRRSQITKTKKDPNDQQHCYDYSVFFLTLSQLGHARGGLTVSGRRDTAEMIPCPRL